MSFQILDSEGNAIDINELDAEACALWGKTIDPKHYAYPEVKPDKFDGYKDELEFYRNVTNWFDYIGGRIHYDNLETWQSIRDHILKPFAKFPIEEIMEYRPIGGYIKLIDHWESKGYQPKRVD